MFDHSSMMFPETAHFSGRVVHNIYEIIIEEHFKTRDPLCYFKAIVKKEPIVTTFDEKQFNIYCDIQKNNQRLDHRQIIDFITQTFGF